MASNSWVMHHGRGAPLPAGTLVQVLRFNGDVDTFHIGAGQIISADGSPMPSGNARWSCWNHEDGGPRSVKAKSYRVLVEASTHARNAAMFRGWLSNPAPADKGELV